MSRVALSYEIPFVDSVTMPAGWARWLASQGSTPNETIRNAPEEDGTITWRYEDHGLLPWMQFFYDWRFADLTGDGKIDFVLTSGTMRQIAYKQDGAELWRYEDPTGSFLDVRPDVNCPVVDIDGDGVAELVCPRKMDGVLYLCIVNARTGAIKHSVPYPNPLHGIPRRGGYLRSSITVINATGGERPSDILICWDYRSITLLDRHLAHLWTQELPHAQGRTHMTIGHSPHAGDIDGDDRDEILASSCLLNHDGTLLWVAPDLPALVTDGHADSVQIVRLTEGRRPNMVMSTGAYCFSADGELLWGRDDLKHGQAQRVGKIRADVPGQQMVVYEGASRVDPALPDRVIALDDHGNTLWDFEIVQPDIQEGGFGFWLGDWDGDGLDEVFVNGPHEIVVLDGDGTLLETLPNHLIYVFDLVGDSRAEAIVLTGIEPGMQLQIVTNDEPNQNPATKQAIARRITTPAMYNVTRY